MSKITLMRFDLVLLDAPYRPGNRFGPDSRHAAWQWDHLRAGRMEMRTPGAEPVAVRAGEAVLTPPGVPHRFRWRASCRLDSIRFDWPAAPDTPPGGMVRFGPEDLPETLLHRFLDAARFSDPLSRASAASALHLLLAERLRPARGAETDDPAARVRRRLEAGGFGPVSVRELAADAGLSVNHFIRVFRRAAGETPGRFVLACRIDRARELMARGGLGAAAVADALGFPDPYTFAKAFKRVTGLPPGAWAARGRRRPA